MKNLLRNDKHPTLNLIIITVPHRNKCLIVLVILFYEDKKNIIFEFTQIVLTYYTTYRIISEIFISEFILKKNQSKAEIIEV